MTRRRPPRITPDTWDPVGILADYYRDTWQIQGAMLPGGDWRWLLERRHPVPPGAAEYGVVEIRDFYAPPEWIRAWLIDQADRWERSQQ